MAKNINNIVWILLVIIALYFISQSDIFVIDFAIEIDESISVPTPPCIETDAGLDYIERGTILSGVNIEDECINRTTLREGYCDTNLTYRLIDINCPKEYEEDDYICENGRCRYISGGAVTAPTPTERTGCIEKNCIEVRGVF